MGEYSPNLVTLAVMFCFLNPCHVFFLWIANNRTKLGITAEIFQRHPRQRDLDVKEVEPGVRQDSCRI
jgi:hypothetical protein